MAAQQVCSPSPTPDVGAVLARLDRLAPDERLTALAEWVGELRIVVNRNERREDEGIRARRLAVVNEIVRIWPSRMDDASLRSLANRLSGPGQGAWATSTTDEVFAPLVEDGRLSWDQIEALWFALVAECLDPMLSGEGKHRFFYEPDDAGLTRALARSLVRCDPRRGQERRAHLAKSRLAAARTLAVPFARSRESTRWADACDGLRWMLALLDFVRLEGSGILPEEELGLWATDRSAVDALVVGIRDRRESPVEAFALRVAQELAQRSREGDGG